ncbi:hypothetical protein A3D42_01275 [Candidatus Nomurabacteria bacterium RIFCSPHIGHO2_02_FULL_41_18]|uniref:Thioredoxin domain-containing protein n=1 Tax=Candidatus Nomurabacteria bacterium RIFCSPHIGHO2_02_FULL_41_18 TaxID=1801754 RepID=A0A1F6W7A6_9BACT|nr:MAG: hypothetical protein A2737_00025 [Candidatus Nomurabacteria bacterium RIFCSPHIGHO2_01_FULL_41_71]OGI77827.1 MAG: hypothetical protein A3D42_01275 [Candidatus Nomurabacteria bacterium RIFCSPHIGHO2_02_FULL_41_18]OGI89977.1 MAG: hypothetical protein A3B01_01925 [Candidatus Nomurabacteria bacterium RIFCSPLOWO2_01_FULL_41_52b]OGJ00489.1 MAG: hypothetical protein A3I90_00515 [Candidatus Nomurabacteria bacterium RIFCSPLOWO2_02_FULL_41_9]
MQNNKQMAGAIILAGVIIAGAILLKGNTIRPPGGQAENFGNSGNPPEINIRAVSEKDHIWGDKNAKVVVVEYSDTECPFCKIFHATMHRIVEENKGKVAWVYRHYPIPELHSKAPRQAEATECAYEQGGNDAFWKYIDRIFVITPSNNGLPDEELTNIAEYLGFNTSSFYTCLESGKYKNKVESDIADGKQAKVNGTPSSYILVNGKVVDLIPGAQPYETVIEKLNAIK